MISQKYSEQEQNNLNEIEELLNKSSNYATIGAGGKAVLRFLPERKIEEVEKTYNGQTVKKVRFIVIDPNSGSKGFDLSSMALEILDQYGVISRSYKDENSLNREVVRIMKHFIQRQT